MSTRAKALKSLVSVVIPVEPGGSVSSALEALKALPKAEKALICEVLVAEGLNPSRQRNLALKAARGAFIQFLDSDSRLMAGALPHLLGAAQGDDVAVVGGPNVALDDESPAGRAFDRVLGSWLGSFTSASRYRPLGVRRDCTEKELILCNLLFRREAYLALGGLREDLYPNEENELFNRAMDHGWRLVYEPEAEVQRPRRQTLSAFGFQAFRYGRGRMQQMRAGFHSSDLINLAPLLLLFAFAAAFSLACYHPGRTGRLVQWAGLFVSVAFSSLAWLNANLTVRLNAWGQRTHAFLGYHFRHWGYALGLLSGLFQRSHQRPLEVEIHKARW